MTDEIIIKNWKKGFSAIQVAKQYMKKYNKEAKEKNSQK